VIIWVMDRWPDFALPAIGYALTFPLMLVCLPATRRLARVKGEHIARAVVFSLAWIVPLVLFRFGRNIESILAQQSSNTPAAWLNGPRRIGDSAPELWGILIFAWISLWWLSTFVVGWKLTRGLLVWALLTVTAGLVAAIAAHWEDLVMVYFT
jgi:hypothetical protein